MEVSFYKTCNGKCPVEEFLDLLEAKQARKVTWVLRLIEELEQIPGQYFKKLVHNNDIWEVRVVIGKASIRILGFIHRGNIVVLTNGFIKKSQKTPQGEIQLAETRKKEVLEREIS